MPQFDFISFFVQIFWFSVAAFGFYLIHLINYSKNIAEVFKIRNKINNFADVTEQKIKISDLYDQVMKSIKHK